MKKRVIFLLAILIGTTAAIAATYKVNTSGVVKSSGKAIS